MDGCELLPRVCGGTNRRRHQYQDRARDLGLGVDL